MNAAVIAFEQNPATGYLYSLTLDGVDVIAKVATESIRVTEAGSGGVSSMSFTIWDTDSTVTVADGAHIGMWDYTRDLPVFAGFLDHIVYRPWAATGRFIEVTAFGLEALLDVIIVPSQTFTPATESSTTDAGSGVQFAWYGTPALQSLASYAPLNAASASTDSGHGYGIGGEVASSQANPVSGYGFAAPATFATMTAFTVSGPIRSCFESFFQNTVLTPSGATSLGTSIMPAYYLSVDLWGGIRFFMLDTSAFNMWPTDYATLTVTTAASPAPENITWERDMSPGAVTTYMYGTSGSVSGWRSLNTTLGRRETFGSSSQNIPTSLDPLAPAINNTLAPRSSPAGRGSFTLTEFTPINAHPGGQIVMTDARLGFASKSLLITQIDKTFKESGDQDWVVFFMDAAEKPASGPANVAILTRTLTRGTLN